MIYMAIGCLLVHLSVDRTPYSRKVTCIPHACSASFSRSCTPEDPTDRSFDSSATCPISLAFRCRHVFVFVATTHSLDAITTFSPGKAVVRAHNRWTCDMSGDISVSPMPLPTTLVLGLRTPITPVLTNIRVECTPLDLLPMKPDIPGPCRGNFFLGILLEESEPVRRFDYTSNWSPAFTSAQDPHFPVHLPQITLSFSAISVVDFGAVEFPVAMHTVVPQTENTGM